MSRPNYLLTATDELPIHRDKELVVRRMVQLLITAVGLLGSAVLLASTAVAAPAEPYKYSDCFDQGGGFVYCQEGQGTFRINDTPSGKLMSTASGSFSYTLTLNGQVIAKGSGSPNNEAVLLKDGATQVTHVNNKGQFSYVQGGITYTCTFGNNFTIANGEYRHSVSDFQCTP
jgi:hypothetical protein